MSKTALLKWFLFLSGLSQIGYWGLSHLFFPKWYLRSVGMTELAKNPGPVLIFMNEIGVLTIGVGFATILASRNPVKNLAIILMLYVISLGSIGTSIYHIVVNHTATGEWSTVIIISLQLIVLTALYPWKKTKGAS
jgi:hypothetical protein